MRLQMKGEQLMLLSIRRAAAVGLGLVLAANALWASGEEEAAAEAEFVDVELTKLDGTTMTREYEKPRYGGTVTMNREVLILMHSWDPKGGGGPHELANLQLLNQKLTQVDWARGPSGTGEYPNFVAPAPPLYAVGNLAESWEYITPTKLRFKIREGVRFWNKEDVVQPNPGLEDDYGRELTAHDAAWSYKTTNFFQHGSPASITWTAIDDHTLEMTWPQPDATESGLLYSGFAFIFNSGMANIPADQWTDWRNALGTGAFIPIDEVPGSTVTYKRNPNYWENDPIHTENRLPYVDDARIVDIDDEAGIIAALRAGQLDLTNGLGSSGKWGLQLKDTNTEIGQAPAAPTPTVWVPRVDLPDSPFSDIKVRQALMMAIPRDEVVEDFYGGFALQYSYPTFPTFPDYFVAYEDLPTEPTLPGSCASARDVVTYNPDKARDCLAQAGFPDGFEFDLWSPPGEAEFNELYQGVWREVGIRANLKVVELAVWQSVKDREDHLGLTSWTPGMWQDPFSMLINHLSSKATINSARVSDPLYDEILVVVEQELDNDKRIAAWQEFFPKALEQAVYPTGVAFDKLTFWNPWVKGYSGEISNVGIQGWASLAKSIWIDTDMQP
jgi:peptide/nickel transport system substrate-binding protein